MQDEKKRIAARIRVKRYKEKQAALGNCDCGKKKEKQHSRCPTCLEACNRRSKDYAKRDRLLCIKAYGGHCKCCGTDVEKYLQLDHIEGGGNEHRKIVYGRKEGDMAKWARKNGFPSILQLLCANCHQAKTKNQSCSTDDHKRMIYGIESF